MTSVENSAAAPMKPDGVRRWLALILLALILLAALALRGYLIVTTTLVSRDTVTFIQIANRLMEDPQIAMRENDQHPLYPVLILGMHRARAWFGVGDSPEAWALSAQCVSCLGGLACVLGMYLLSSRVFDKRIGLLSALFMAVLPEGVQYSADGLSDMVHLSLYLFGMWAAVRGFQERELLGMILAGLLSGVAFLARPEGLAVALVTIVGLIRYPPGWRWSRRAAVAACVVGGFAVWAVPYGLITGEMIQKKSLPKLIGAEADAGRKTAMETSAPVRETRCVGTVARASAFPAATVNSSVLRIFPKLVEDWVRSLRVTYVALFVIGLLPLTGRRAQSPAGLLLAGAAGLHLLAVILVANAYGYFSLRHLMVPAALCLPHAGVGATFLIDLLSAKVAVFRNRVVSVALVLTATIAPTLPWALRALGSKMSHYVAAAQYIHGQYPQDTVVVTTRFRIAYFADLRWQPWPDEGRVDDLLAHTGAEREIIVLDEAHVRRRNARFFEELAEAAIEPGRLKLAKEFPAPPGARPTRVLIFEVIKNGKPLPPAAVSESRPTSLPPLPVSR